MAVDFRNDWRTAERGLLQATEADGDTVTLTRDDVEALISLVDDLGMTNYNDGEQDGRDYGYDDGYADGEAHGDEIADERYQEGYDNGYSEGYSEGLAEGGSDD